MRRKFHENIGPVNQENSVTKEHMQVYNGLLRITLQVERSLSSKGKAKSVGHNVSHCSVAVGIPSPCR